MPDAAGADLRSLARAAAPAFVGQTLRAFSIPGFWRVWTGSMIWYSARWMDLFVLQWQVLVLTGSPLQVALIGFYRMAPMFLFGLVSGLAADRISRRRVILASQGLAAAASAGLAGLLLADRLALWHLPFLVTALGLAWTFDLPSRRALIFDLMGSGRVVNALALDNLGMDGAKMLGPLLGGLLWPLIGAGGCFVLLTIGYVVNFCLYLGLPRVPSVPSSGSGSLLGQLREGVAYVSRNPVILGVLAITAIANLLGFPYQNLVPVIAKEVLGLGSQLAGLLFAAEGVGATLAALILASRGEVVHKGRVFGLGSVCILGGVLLFSFSSWYPLSFGLLMLVGAGIGCFGTLQSSLILLSASAAMRGRAMGTLILAIGFAPLGALQIGGLASLTGAPAAVGLTTGVGLACLAVLLWRATALWNFRSGG
jgi:MFS family permease